MGLSEKIDSGRFSGGRSNFSQTCSLLSQYLKEKRSFGDLSLELAQPKGTMDLLPMIEKSGQNSVTTGNLNMLPQLAAGGVETLNRSETGTGPMTIFYAGQVIVFNDFPADKAKEIMTLASKSSASLQNPLTAAFAPPQAAQKPAESATSTPTFGVQELTRRPPLPAIGSEFLPIARKHSLARFLEKRKDRITANAPYQASKPAPPPKAVKTEAWLGLASEYTHQIQRH